MNGGTFSTNCNPTVSCYTRSIDAYARRVRTVGAHDPRPWRSIVCDRMDDGVCVSKEGRNFLLHTTCVIGNTVGAVPWGGRPFRSGGLFGRVAVAVVMVCWYAWSVVTVDKRRTTSTRTRTLLQTLPKNDTVPTQFNVAYCRYRYTFCRGIFRRAIRIHSTFHTEPQSSFWTVAEPFGRATGAVVHPAVRTVFTKFRR